MIPVSLAGNHSGRDPADTSAEWFERPFTFRIISLPFFSANDGGYRRTATGMSRIRQDHQVEPRPRSVGLSAHKV